MVVIPALSGEREGGGERSETRDSGSRDTNRRQATHTTATWAKFHQFRHGLAEFVRRSRG